MNAAGLCGREVSLSFAGMREQGISRKWARPSIPRFPLHVSASAGAHCPHCRERVLVFCSYGRDDFTANRNRGAGCFCTSGRLPRYLIGTILIWMPVFLYLKLRLLAMVQRLAERFIQPAALTIDTVLRWRFDIPGAVTRPLPFCSSRL